MCVWGRGGGGFAYFAMYVVGVGGGGGAEEDRRGERERNLLKWLLFLALIWHGTWVCS